MNFFFYFTDCKEDKIHTKDAVPEVCDGAKNRLRGIIRKGIVQRKAARRFARKNIQFLNNVDVYAREESNKDGIYGISHLLTFHSFSSFVLKPSGHDI